MDIPSLFMIPSAVSSGKVHSVFPNSTDADFDFARSSTATRVNSNGLIESVASGQARLNYEIEGGLVNTKPSLLLEPQSTNLVLNSKTGAYGNAPASEKNTIAPDNTNTAIIPIPNSTADRYEYNITGGTYATDTKLTYSWYSKQITQPSQTYTGNLNTSILTNATQVGSTIKVKDLINGWAKYSATFNITNGASLATLRFYFGQIIGVGNESVAYWGHQLEVLSYCTTLIPTNGSTQTRAAETCNGAGTSSIFESSEGILYAEIAALETPTTSALDISISNGATTNYVRLEYYTDGKIYGTIYDGSFAASSTTVTQTNFNKIAVFWRTSGSKFALNGAITNFTGKTFSANTFNTLQFAAGNGTSAPFYGKIRDIRVYNTKEMTDSEVDILLTKITS